MMKTVFALLTISASATAFTRPASTFAGRVTGVYNRKELSCPPASYAKGRQAMNMSFLKRLGLGGDKKEKEVAVDTTTEKECILPEDVEEKTETEKLLQQVKDAGLAGVISYAAWELAFWTVSVPVCILGYREVTGHWPDLSNKEDVSRLGAEAFAFVNFARFAVPLRIGLALSTTPWVEENIVERFMKKKEPPVCEPVEEGEGEPAATE